MNFVFKAHMRYDRLAELHNCVQRNPQADMAAAAPVAHQSQKRGDENVSENVSENGRATVHEQFRMEA